MIDIALRDVLIPMATVVTGILTGLIAGERKIRADRATETARRRADARRADLDEASKLLQEYLALRPTREVLWSLLDRTPSGQPPLDLLTLDTELRNTAQRLQILLTDEADARLVSEDQQAVATWLIQTRKALNAGNATGAAPDAKPLIDLARRLRQAIVLTDDPEDSDRRGRRPRRRRSAKP